MLFQRTTAGKRISTWFAAALTSMVVECGVPRHPQELTVSKAADFRPADPTDIHTIEQALAAIMTVCRDDLHLPVVDPLHVHLYKNSASYAFYGYGWRILPFDVANQVATAKKIEILIDLGKVDKTYAASIQLLAREYGHVIHEEMAGEHVPSAFVAEGFADWVTARVLHSLGCKIMT